MANSWEDIKWIFEPDGVLRDIYVKKTNIEDWKILIDHLNINYTLKYGPTGENSIINKIDKDYLIRLLNDEVGEMELKTVSILIDDIMINTHFFSINEIEFDIDPKEINSPINYEKILNFMNQISQVLNRPIILTGENQAEFPLIKVDFSKN